MNLSVSSVSNTANKNINFGMARFTKQGMKIARECQDVYECLSKPNHYQIPEFFKRKGLFEEAPFTKYLRAKLPAKKEAAPEYINEVKDMINYCGTSDNSSSNANFIKQLISSEPYIESLGDDTRIQISESIQEVFNKNWNNPELSKRATQDLLEMARPSLSDLQYATLVGVIEKSDI